MIAKQALRFAVTGAMATIIHVAIAILLHETMQFTPLSANFAAFLCAWLFSYIGNFFWTFEQTSKHRQSAVRFAVTALAGIILNQLFVWGVTSGLGLSLRWALVPVVLVVPVLSFIASRYWAFRPTDKPLPMKSINLDKA